MSWGSSNDDDVPEPFRYSRAHSYPQTFQAGLPPEPLKPRGSRTLFIVLAGVALVALLLTAITVKAFSGDPVAVATPSATPTLEPQPTIEEPDAPTESPSPSISETPCK